MADNTILYGKWYFNDIIDALNVPTTSLNFKYIIGNKIYNGIKIGIYSGTQLFTYYNEDNSWNFPNYSNWDSDGSYRTIWITSGGTDTFLTWLQANATKVSDSLDNLKTNKMLFEENLNELVDIINNLADSSDSKTITELVKIAKSIVKPSGTKLIIENGNHNVKEYEYVNVALPSGDGEIRSLKKILDYTKSTMYMFKNNNKITDLTDYFEYSDTSNVTNMNEMFSGCSVLKTIPLFDTSNVTVMQTMFSGCLALMEVPLFDTSKVTNMYMMFSTCSALMEVPLFDTSKVTNMYMMFAGCENLKTIPQFDTSNVTDMGYLFRNAMNYAVALETIPVLDTSKVTNMQYMFENQNNLITVEGLNLIKITSVSYVTSMFKGCTKLTNLTLYNIKVNLTIGSGSTYGHLLTIESLLNTCQECIKQSSTRTLTVGTANIEKLASVYVKLTDTTDVSKYPMVQCESTDEGAMLVADYMALKNWSLA